MNDAAKPYVGQFTLPSANDRVFIKASHPHRGFYEEFYGPDYLLILIAWELHRIYIRLANGFPTEEEKEQRYARWWAALPTDRKAWYQQHPDEWEEAERDVRRTASRSG